MSHWSLDTHPQYDSAAISEATPTIESFYSQVLICRHEYASRPNRLGGGAGLTWYNPSVLSSCPASAAAWFLQAVAKLVRAKEDEEANNDAKAKSMDTNKDNDHHDSKSATVPSTTTTRVTRASTRSAAKPISYSSSSASSSASSSSSSPSSSSISPSLQYPSSLLQHYSDVLHSEGEDAVIWSSMSRYLNRPGSGVPSSMFASMLSTLFRVADLRPVLADGTTRKPCAAEIAATAGVKAYKYELSRVATIEYNGEPDMTESAWCAWVTEMIEINKKNEIERKRLQSEKNRAFRLAELADQIELLRRLTETK